jgi:hypothetical protein
LRPRSRRAAREYDPIVPEWPLDDLSRRISLRDAGQIFDRYYRHHVSFSGLRPVMGSGEDDESGGKLAWAAWTAWRGGPDLVANIGRRVEDVIEDQAEAGPAITLAVLGDIERYSSVEAFTTCVTKQGLAKFETLTIEQHASGRRAIAVFVRVRRKLGMAGHGVVLRVEDASGEAPAGRDAIAAAIARGTRRNQKRVTGESQRSLDEYVGLWSAANRLSGFVRIVYGLIIALSTIVGIALLLSDSEGVAGGSTLVAVAVGGGLAVLAALCLVGVSRWRLTGSVVVSDTPALVSAMRALKAFPIGAVIGLVSQIVT